MFDSFPSPWALVKLLTEFMITTGATPQDWSHLNSSVGGRLHIGVPFSQPCFKYTTTGELNVQYDEEKCAEIQKRNEDHIFRSEHFGSYELPQWETCQTDGDQCMLDWKEPTNQAAFAPPRQCKQGSVPERYIDVRGPNDVRAAFAFTHKTKVPLVIKNSGHDYFGRSSGPGTLALWTRKLDKLVLDRKWTPAGCPEDTATATAMIVGAGQNFRAVYDMARDNNVTVVSGADPSVGASGGWVMGGGHSSMSPALGLGVDRVLEFKIVTPDGAYRTVNRCQNTDLFWALRGGGGGTFGVVLESTFMASPQVTVHSLLGLYDNTKENSVKLLKALAKTAVQFGKDGWGGYVTPSLSSAIWGNPLLDEAAARKSAQPVIEAFESVGGKHVWYTMESSADWFDTFIAPNTDQVGRPQILTTRLIPENKFDDDIMLDSMIDTMLDSDFSQILVVAPTGFKDYDKDATSIHPGWRKAVWHALASYNWNYDSTLEERVQMYQRATNKWATVRERTPDAAVYMNEADTYEPNWQEVYWGPNYPRLLEIKNKYDPDHILDCWRCVGWKGDQDSRYKCYPRAEVTSTKEDSTARPSKTHTDL